MPPRRSRAIENVTHSVLVSAARRLPLSGRQSSQRGSCLIYRHGGCCKACCSNRLEPRHDPSRRRSARRLPRGTRRRPGVLRAWRKLPRRARCSARQQRGRDGDLPARRRSRLHGDCRCQDHASAGDRVRQPRPGRDQCVDCRARGRAGCGADDPVHRPGAARRGGPWRIPGGRLQPDVRRHGEDGRHDRQCRAHSRDRRPRLRRGTAADPGRGRDRAAGGHARGSHRRAGRATDRFDKGRWRCGGRCRAGGGDDRPVGASADDHRRRSRGNAGSRRSAGGGGGARPAGGANVQAPGAVSEHTSALCRPPGFSDTEVAARHVHAGRSR